MSGLVTYTTTIAVEKTLGEIQAMLARGKARSITVDYDGAGNPTAISFVVETSFGERAFELPANCEGVWRTLTRQHQQGRVARRFATREQAARVGWRIIRNWLEAQLAMIEVGLMSLEQVMLAHMLVGPDQRSLYAAMQERQMALPAGEGSR